MHLTDGLISAVTPPGSAPADGGDRIGLDLAGYVLVPAAAETHAHLDKALLAGRVPNPSGDLAGAIKAIRAAYPSMTSQDITDRAKQAIRLAVASGYTAVRTHCDCGPIMGTRSVEALIAIRDSLRDVVDIQVVALAEPGLTGPRGRPNRDILAAALALGADLVGGCPSIDDDPPGAVAELLAIARDCGRGLDLHVDETLDPSVLALRDLARQVVATGFSHPVTASHCVSLGAQDPAVAREVSREVADAGISIVTLPQSNLFLQGRDAPKNTPRGLTAIHQLLSYGVLLAGGSDNWRDPFNPMGRIDPLETASLLVSAGHLTPEAAYDCVTTHARAALGLPPVRIEAGSPADLLAVRGDNLADVVAGASQERVVLRAGQVLASTTVRREWDPTLNALLARPDQDAAQS